MPRPRANARPAASARLLTTAAMRASHRSSAQARTIASMLEPRPEMRMTMFFIGARSVSAPPGALPTISRFSRPAVDERSTSRAKQPDALGRRRRGGDLAAPRPLRNAPDRCHAPGPLARRAQELGAAAGPLRVL